MSQMSMSASLEGTGLLGQHLQVACDPGSIEVGVSCGMTGMCGESPCLCGSPDAWGDCACNGIETVAPAIDVASDDPLAALPVKVSDGWQVISFLPGEAHLTVSAQLKHYDDASIGLQFASSGPSPCVFGGLLAVVVLCACAAVAIKRSSRRKKAKTARDVSESMEDIDE